MAETSDPPTELDISGTSETLKGKLETSVKASKEEEDEIKDTMAKRSHQLTEPDTSWTSGTLKEGQFETEEEEDEVKPLSSLSLKAESPTDEQHLHLKGQMKTVAKSKEDEDDKLKVSVQVHQAEEKQISEDETIESKVEELSLSAKPITHLQEVLNVFNEQTAKFHDNEKIDILLKLPYLTIGFFDNKGGILSLDRYDVHLYIPRGAIPEHQTQQVYIYIDPDATPPDIGNYKGELLSPEIHCGPPGLAFLDTVVLSFPHHVNESSNWKLDPRICPDTLQDWQALDSSKDGQLVSSKGNSAVFLVSHFSKYLLCGIPSPHSSKRVNVGAFGDLYNSSHDSHTFRIYVWKDDKVSEQKVLEMEKRMNSEILDAFRGLNFLNNQEDMEVEISKLKEGWCMRENTSEKQTIRWDCIWNHPQSSVTFDLMKQGNDGRNTDTINIPHCDVNCYQLAPDTESTWQGAEVRLSIKPKQPVPPNEDLRCDISHRLPMENIRSVQPVQPNGDLRCDISHRLPMENIRTKVLDAIKKKAARREFGDYGGLSENNVVAICSCLSTCNGKELREYLSGTGYIPSTILERNVLKTYFAKCAKLNICDEDAVGYLKWVSHCLDFVNAVKIIDETDLNIDENRVKEMIEQSEPLKVIAVEICFREIADGLGQEWEKLGTFLGIQSDKLDEVKRNNACVDDRIFKMLLICQNEVNRLDNTVTKKLADNLERIDRKDLADKLNRRVTSMKFFQTAPERETVMNSRTETVTTQISDGYFSAEDENLNCTNQLPAPQPAMRQDSVRQGAAGHGPVLCCSWAANPAVGHRRDRCGTWLYSEAHNDEGSRDFD